MFKTITVTTMDNVTKIIVNRRYLPINGTTRDVGGINSARSKKKTVKESKMDIQSATFSPESDGK
jgi:hypothetical protein